MRPYAEMVPHDMTRGETKLRALLPRTGVTIVLRFFGRHICVILYIISILLVTRIITLKCFD